MNARHPFEIACKAPLRTLLAPEMDSRHDLLVVSGGLFLEHAAHVIMANRTNVFVAPLKKDGDDADEMLNRIVSWMKNNNVLDQRPIHGESRHDYNITFSCLPAGDASYLSVRDNFFLEDFVFDHCHPADAGHFDDLMRMLDRYKMCDAMMSSLKNDFGMPVRENAPAFWLRDILPCSHPDHKRYEQPVAVPA